MKYLSLYGRMKSWKTLQSPRAQMPQIQPRNFRIPLLHPRAKWQSPRSTHTDAVLKSSQSQSIQKRVLAHHLSRLLAGLHLAIWLCFLQHHLWWGKNFRLRSQMMVILTILLRRVIETKSIQQLPPHNPSAMVIYLAIDLNLTLFFWTLAIRSFTTVSFSISTLTRRIVTLYSHYIP